MTPSPTSAAGQPSAMMIVACSSAGWIGDPAGQMPWHQRADLKHFKQATQGASLILGRKTLESIGRLLPGRPHCVLSRQPMPDTPWMRQAREAGQLHWLGDWDQLREHMRSTGGEFFVAGGGEIYRQAFVELDIVGLLLTEIDADFPEASESDGWARFPLEHHLSPRSNSGWFDADDENRYRYRFLQFHQ